MSDGGDLYHFDVDVLPRHEQAGRLGKLVAWRLEDVPFLIGSFDAPQRWNDYLTQVCLMDCGVRPTYICVGSPVGSPEDVRKLEVIWRQRGLGIAARLRVATMDKYCEVVDLAQVTD